MCFTETPEDSETAESRRLPRWSAPISGAGLGVVLSFRAMKRDGQAKWMYPVAGAILGGLAGGVLWLIDTPTGDERRVSAIGSLLAVLAVFPGILPFIGIAFCLPAFVLNRRVAGWQNRVSRLGLCVCVLLTIVAMVAYHVPLK
jgi:hypothetical protein